MSELNNAIKHYKGHNRPLGQDAEAELERLQAEHKQLFDFAVLAMQTVTKNAYPLPKHLEPLDSYLANQLDDLLWERVDAKAVQE